MEVLGLCSYPVEAAATRYRLIQFKSPLAEKGINLTILPFLDSERFASLYRSGGTISKALSMIKPLRQRLYDSISARNYDVLFVQREALLFGPPVFEWLAKNLSGRPMVLDLDDATYVGYKSPTYGRLGSALRFFGKTDSLIDWSELVVCGNRFIAEYVEKRGRKAVVIPTVVDTDVFHPVEKNNRIPVIGWVGTHSTFPSLESLFPVLENLALKHEFILKIVGAGRQEISIKGVKIENLPWKLEREVEDFQSIDIGLYPIKVSSSANMDWILGKSGFKAIQYLALGIPFVMTPIGVCDEIGEPNLTHFNAANEEGWYNSLDSLLADAHLRARMGSIGRKHSLKHYTVPDQAATLSQALETLRLKK